MKAITRTALLGAPLLLLGCEPPVDEQGPEQLFDPEHYRIVDLTHPFDEDTVYWPTSPHGFELDELHYGETEAGFFYSAHRFETPEHGGTHLDAPIHFYEEGRTTDEVGLEELAGAAVVIDVRQEAEDDRDYALTPDRLEAWEDQHGEIPEDSIVLLRTGWDRYWPEEADYLGDDSEDDASNLSFPSYGPEAAEMLVAERDVAALGVDTASIDPGEDEMFTVHQIVAEHQVPVLENLTGLDELPKTGAWVVAMPMKIADGSGGPLRAAAFVPAGQ